MKSLLLITACALAAVSTMAQGTVRFLNFDRQAGIDQAITDIDHSTKIAGTDYVAQLWAGPVGGALQAITTGGPNNDGLAPFLTGTGSGYWSTKSPDRLIPGVAAGSSADAQVYVWESKYADLATAQAQGGKWGISTKFTLPKTGGQGADPNVPPALSEPLVGFTAFSLQVVPEPSTIALGLLGAAALMIRRRK